MRSTTLLASIWRACILAVAILALPQLASAQLPLETKSLKIQATSGTNAVTLTASTVATPYALNFPDAVGPAGGILYIKTSASNSAQLAYTSTAGIQAGWSPVWNGTDIVWVDPTTSANPNWSRTGNTVGAAGGVLGTKDNFGFNIITNDVARIEIAADGAISINNATNIDGGLTINDVGLTVTAGGATITGATNINTTGTATTSIGATGGTITTVGSLGHTGTSSFTGNLTLAGAASALIASDGTNASPGDVGHVLTSDGANKTPIWKSINDAVGIKKTGKIAIAQDASLNQVVTATGMAAGDAVLITLQTTTGVYAVVTATAADQFTVQYTGAATGSLTYMVLDTTN